MFIGDPRTLYYLIRPMHSLTPFSANLFIAACRKLCQCELLMMPALFLDLFFIRCRLGNIIRIFAIFQARRPLF